MKWADNDAMGLRPMIWSAAVSIMVCAWWPSTSAAGADPLRGLAKRIVSTSRPDSAAVLLVSDDRLLEKLRSRLRSLEASSQSTISWNASEKLGQMGPGVVPVLVPRIADPNRFVRERVQDALLFATQDERILARTVGDYLKFYEQPARSPQEIVEAWWKKFGRYWTLADTTR